MQLTKKLFSYLPTRVLRGGNLTFTALRLRYDNYNLGWTGGWDGSTWVKTSMTWKVSDGWLYTYVSKGPGEPLSIDLRAHTIGSLVALLNQQPGYAATLLADAGEAALGARIIGEADGNQDRGGGDLLYGHPSIEYAYLDAAASELSTARTQIQEMLKQLTTVTAEDEWLDEIGDYYGVRRKPGESNGSYGVRIVHETVRPRVNNVAIEMALIELTGGEPASVVDVIESDGLFPLYDGEIFHDGVRVHNHTGASQACLFDVTYSSAQSSDPALLELEVRALIESYRALGCHLRTLTDSAAS